MSGPHGTHASAIKSLSFNGPVLENFDKHLKTHDGSFTVAFFLQTAKDVSSGGVFEFVDSEFGTVDKSFQIHYSNHTIILTSNKYVIGNYQLIQRKSTWTFLAFSFDSTTAELSIFSEHGLAHAPTIQPFLVASNTFNNGGFRLGFSSVAKAGLNPGDTVS